MCFPEKTSKSCILTFTLITVFSSLSFLLILSLIVWTPPLKLLSQFLNSFRSFHPNITIPSHAISGINAIIYLYLFFIYLFIIFILIKLFSKHIKDVSLPSIVLHCAVITFSVLTIFQAAGLFKNYLIDYQIFANKSLDQKNQIIESNHSYAFAQFCHTILPGRHTAKLVTDLDLSRDPGMFIYRQFAYYLYPIDNRNIRNEPVDTLIIFIKNNARKNIPDNFQIIGTFNKNNLIAIKKAQQ
jgi:hypothetical protein